MGGSVRLIGRKLCMLDGSFPIFGIQIVCWLGHERGYVLCLVIVFHMLHRIGVSIGSASSHPTAGTDHLGDAFPGLSERIAMVTSGSVQGPCNSSGGESSGP